MHTRTWHIEVVVFEQDDIRTCAEAILRTDAGTQLRHKGTARKRPGDRDVPEIGDEEFATCRALTHDLLEATILDVEANDPGPGRPTIALDDEVQLTGAIGPRT